MSGKGLRHDYTFSKSCAFSLVSVSSSLINALYKDSLAPNKELNDFIVVILKRSRSSNLTLLVALLYCLRLEKLLGMKHYSGVLSCRKRTFVGCLILASKFVQDKNYTMASWSIIVGLSSKELAANELQLLDHLQFNLFVSGQQFASWSKIISHYVGVKDRKISVARISRWHMVNNDSIAKA